MSSGGDPIYSCMAALFLGVVALKVFRFPAWVLAVGVIAGHLVARLTK